MNNQRDFVSAKYADAVTNPERGAVQATANAKFAFYDDDTLANLPDGIVESSFGCGDPLSMSGVKPGDTVLDLGCGAGLDLLLAAEKVGPTGRVIGVDMTDEMLEKARANVARSPYDTIELRKGVIEDLPIESGSVDWVISNCVINLSAEKTQVFSEIARVLKPGGSMIVSDMVSHNLPFWVRHSKTLTAACGGGAISEDAYLAGLKSVGLQHTAIVARLHYDANDMAGVVLEMVPDFIRSVKCCGESLAQRAITRVAQPVTSKLWSARIYANKPATA